MMPYLAKILVYPIKSFDGVEVENARVLLSGALEYDREFALFDAQGNVVNGKRHAKIHLLRAQFDLANRTISLQIPDTKSPQVFHLDDERQRLEATLSDFFGFAVTLQQNSLTGFPDDLNCPGPVDASRFHHFYKLSVNTRLSAASSASMLQIPNEIVIFS